MDAHSRFVDNLSFNLFVVKAGPRHIVASPRSHLCKVTIIDKSTPSAHQAWKAFTLIQRNTIDNLPPLPENPPRKTDLGVSQTALATAQCTCKTLDKKYTLRTDWMMDHYTLRGGTPRCVTWRNDDVSCTHVQLHCLRSSALLGFRVSDSLQPGIIVKWMSLAAVILVFVICLITGAIHTRRRAQRSSPLGQRSQVRRFSV